MNTRIPILIIGAGVSGIAAAVAVSRMGKKVMLIDNHAYPGGTATASEVGTICGLYHNGKDTASTFLVDGFTREFALKTAAYSRTTPRSNQYGLHYLPYRTDALKSLMGEYISQNGIWFCPGSVLTGLEEENGLLKKAVVHQDGEPMLVDFEAIVDCSGKAVVAELTNHPLVESSYYQAASINFYVTNSAVSDDELSSFKLIRELKTVIQQHQLPDYLKNLFIIPGSQSHQKIGFKFTIPWKVSHEAGAIEDLTIRAKQLVMDFFETLKSCSPMFFNASIDHLADDLGWRTGKRPLGRHILTEEDVISARKWDHPVAKSCWPIEDWLPNRSVDLCFIKDNDYYEIPRECLVSSKYENLFFGGRIISVTDRAIASARVMGVCLQTGYAAGELAAEFSLK